MCLLIYIHEWVITLLSHHFYLMLLTRSFLYQSWWHKEKEGNLSISVFPYLRPCLFRESSAFLRFDALGRDAILLYIYMYLLISERWGEREGEGRREALMMGESHSLFVCLLCAPHWGLDPQPGNVPWLGKWTMTSWFIDQCSTPEPHQPGEMPFLKVSVLAELMLIDEYSSYKKN